MTNKIVELTQRICELDADIHQARVSGDMSSLLRFEAEHKELKDKVTKYYREVLKREEEMWLNGGVL